ncbi:MAG: rhomboid family intramembrane serine protease [Bacteroidetes bacterium]|nr:rhomboid family intramembrane serine protease [Bacteroidota bacterium]MCL1967998.1 rhomboid family intramembrane serine protease [Bacteroidota bacterium]
MSDIRLRNYSLLPPVVKNLLIINAIMYLATVVFKTRGVDLAGIFGLHFFTAQHFAIWQPVTYMFMHGGFWHLFFNMFALWMFGAALENSWGAKRFLLYYMVCGIGAGLIQMLVIGLQVHSLSQNLSPDIIQMIRENGTQILDQGKNYIGEMGALNAAINAVTVGASGSVFGLLLAFGMMYPNSVIYVYFMLPIKAKWFVVFYGALELFYGITGTSDGIAHFAHLGGMLFGFFLILYWNKGNRFFKFKMPAFKKKRSQKYTISSNYYYEPHHLSDEEYNYQKKQKEEKLNRILDKISKTGYESLTQEEKEFLFKQKR